MKRKLEDSSLANKDSWKLKVNLNQDLEKTINLNISKIII